MFAPPDSAPWSRDFVKALAGVATSRAKSARTATRAKSRKPKRTSAPSPAAESESARVALLRSDWGRQSPRLAVAYGDGRVNLELCAGASCLWSGAWQLEVRFGGETMLPVDDWEQVCWISDAEVDYLELEIHLAGEVTVERQMVLARKHRALVLADAVLGIGQAEIEYRGRLPLALGSQFVGEDETREGFLVADGKRRARVLPLALGEWRTAPARGQLQARDRVLELAQSAEGQCLFAPLFIDLNPARLARETTWRQLTVAEDRQIVPADVAVGYRVQAGKSQWLVYRSLAAPAVRSVLAKNLLHQFLLGEVQPSGVVETLVEIDST